MEHYFDENNNETPESAARPISRISNDQSQKYDELLEMSQIAKNPNPLRTENRSNLEYLNNYGQNNRVSYEGHQDQYKEIRGSYYLADYHLKTPLETMQRPRASIGNPNPQLDVQRSLSQLKSNIGRLSRTGGADMDILEQQPRSAREFPNPVKGKPIVNILKRNTEHPILEKQKHHLRKSDNSSSGEDPHSSSDDNYGGFEYSSENTDIEEEQMKIRSQALALADTTSDKFLPPNVEVLVPPPQVFSLPTSSPSEFIQSIVSSVGRPETPISSGISEISRILAKEMKTTLTNFTKIQQQSFDDYDDDENDKFDKESCNDVRALFHRSRPQSSVATQVSATDLQLLHSNDDAFIGKSESQSVPQIPRPSTTSLLSVEKKAKSWHDHTNTAKKERRKSSIIDFTKFKRRDKIESSTKEKVLFRHLHHKFDPTGKLTFRHDVDETNFPAEATNEPLKEGEEIDKEKEEFTVVLSPPNFNPNECAVEILCHEQYENSQPRNHRGYASFRDEEGDKICPVQIEAHWAGDLYNENDDNNYCIKWKSDQYDDHLDYYADADDDSRHQQIDGDDSYYYTGMTEDERRAIKDAEAADHLEMMELEQEYLDYDQVCYFHPAGRHQQPSTCTCRITGPIIGDWKCNEENREKCENPSACARTIENEKNFIAISSRNTSKESLIDANNNYLAPSESKKCVQCESTGFLAITNEFPEDENPEFPEDPTLEPLEYFEASTTLDFRSYAGVGASLPKVHRMNSSIAFILAEPKKEILLQREEIVTIGKQPENSFPEMADQRVGVVSENTYFQPAPAASFVIEGSAQDKPFISCRHVGVQVPDSILSFSTTKFHSQIFPNVYPNRINSNSILHRNICKQHDKMIAAETAKMKEKGQNYGPKRSFFKNRLKSRMSYLNLNNVHSPAGNVVSPDSSPAITRPFVGPMRRDQIPMRHHGGFLARFYSCLHSMFYCPC